MSVHAHCTDLPELVEYGCGCVGFPAGAGGFALLVWWCDGDGEPHSLGMRNMSGKPCTPINADRATGLINSIARLANDGKKFRELKGLLK